MAQSKEEKYAYNRQYRIDHKDEIKRRTKQHDLDNREQLLKRKRDFSNRNREHESAYTKQYRIDHKDKYDALYMKYRLKKNYGITTEDYNKMFEDQEGCCAICGKHQKDINKKLAVDHDHVTGKVRGLLCHKCNIGMGHFNDDINLLGIVIEYLSKNK